MLKVHLYVPLVCTGTRYFHGPFYLHEGPFAPVWLFYTYIGPFTVIWAL